jgi:DoxX-like family
MTIWVLAAVLAAGFAAIGAAKVLALPAMRERAARFGFSVAGYRRIGILEWAGAAGVLVGLVPRMHGTATACVKQCRRWSSVLSTLPTSA